MNAAPLLVAPAVVDQVRRLSAKASPAEACGLLLGRRSPPEVLALAPATNRGPAGRFLIDARALIAAEEHAAEQGLEVLGPWHSHPMGDAEPSLSDHASAALWPGTIWLIAGATITAWRALGDRLSPLPWRPTERGDVLQSAALQAPSARA